VKALKHARFVRSLSKSECRELHQALRKSKSLGERNRIQSVLLSNGGQSVPEIARLLGICSHTVRRAFDRFEGGGVEALREGQHTGRPCKLPP